MNHYEEEKAMAHVYAQRLADLLNDIQKEGTSFIAYATHNGDIAIDGEGGVVFVIDDQDQGWRVE